MPVTHHESIASTKQLPTLWKRTSTGALQYWIIATRLAVGGNGECDIITKYGQEGTQNENATSDTVREGKNLGKKNATTPQQQAELEAQAKWTKQIERKGYVQDKARAERGETDAEGGIAPMLAKKFFAQDQERELPIEKHELEDGGKIKFPALLQPKLDGIRCIAVIEDGTCTLWSRTRKEITSVPHINRFYEKHFGNRSVIVDGELYNNDYADNFEYITELVRPDVPVEGHEVVQHHVYDLPSSESDNETRCQEIADEFHLMAPGSPIVIVPTVTVRDVPHMIVEFRKFREAGYEGAIVRNRKGKYANKRSSDLQKVVETITEEFPIMGVEEGSGKLQGHVGAFWLTAKNGKQFKAKLQGDIGRLKDLFEHPEKWQGKQMTVRYRTLTRKNKVPRFPVAVAIRDYE